MYHQHIHCYLFDPILKRNWIYTSGAKSNIMSKNNIMSKIVV